MLAAIDAAKTRIGTRRVITYGHSQGGYGALKFGRQLSASLALSFSPQWSINPDDVAEFDRRFIGYYDKQLSNGDRIERYDLCPRNFIFVDTAIVVGAINARHLLEFDSVTMVPVPFAGHQTVQVIAEGGAGRALIQRCLEESDVQVGELRTLIRSSRARSQTYANHKTTRLLGTIRRHRRFLETALDGISDGPVKTMLTVKFHLYSGNHNAARTTLESINDEQLLSVDFRQRWNDFRKKCFDYGEARIGPLFKERYPHDVLARLYGVNSMIRTGARDAAIRELATLASMRGAARHVVYFVGFYRQLDRLDLASNFATFAQSKGVSRAERASASLILVEAYHTRQMRTQMFQELVLLQSLCETDIDQAIRVVEFFLMIGEISFALGFLGKIRVPPAYEPLVSLYVADCEARQGQSSAERAIRRLLAEVGGDYRYWLKLSHLAERVVGPDAAVTAARRAVILGQTNQVEARHRLSCLLAASHNHRAAVHELGPVDKPLTGRPATQTPT